MTHLLARPNDADAQGRVHSITPESANWSYVGFDYYHLRSGQSLQRATGDREVCLVLMTGRADASAGGQSWQNLGRRTSVFDGPPWAIYAPNDSSFEVKALTDVELAVCSAPGHGGFPPRLIPPDAMSQETRGRATNTRHVCNILPETADADNLLVVEVITPSGCWSSYPPHKHDQNNLPAESALEETYYHRFDPPQGFGFQRVYTDDGSLDETMTIQNGDVVMVPRGYHPCGAAHGYQLYYLNVMAGPERIWKFYNAPEHEWILAADQAVKES